MILTLCKDLRLLVLTIGSILIAGFFSFIVIPRMEDPVLTERAGIVVTRVPGSTARRVESLVTEVIIKRIREFDEVKEVRSVSRSNVSTVVISLADSIVEVDEVWARIRDKLNDLRSDLPEDAESPDLEIVRARAYASILGLVWRGEQPPTYSILRRTAEELEDALRSIPGTEKVDLFGEPEEEISVEVDQANLASLGLTVDEVSRQIAANDSKRPAGTMRSDNFEALVEVGSELDSLDRIARIPLRSASGGQTAYVGDIADVKKGIVDPARSSAVIQGRPGIMVAASVLTDVRIDRWNGKLTAAVEEFRIRLPRELELVSLFNQTKYVDARINYLVRDLIFSALAVFLVVFFMMGWRSSLVVGAALPLSSCVVLVCLRKLHVPLHQMSLSGLVIALGMLEGTAIIIVDEIQRRVRAGEDRFDAVRHGTAHMALPLFGSAVTTVLSFLPIAIMPGPSGEFVGSIGTSVILALTSSLVLSMTVIPALTAWTAPTTVPAETFWNSGWRWDWLSGVYRRSLRLAFAHPLLTLFAGVLFAAPGFVAVSRVPVQFFPSSDRDQLHVELELPPQASMARTQSVADQISECLKAHPDVASVDWVFGRNAPSFYYNMIGSRQDTPAYAQALVQLRSGRKTVELVRALQNEANEKFSEARVRILMLEQGPPYAAPIEVRISGFDESAMRAYGERIRSLLHSYADVVQTTADLTDVYPKLVYSISEEELQRLNLKSGALSRQLHGSLEGTIGGSIVESNVELPIRVRVKGLARANSTDINEAELLATAADGSRSIVHLASLGTGELKSEPSQITRFNDRPINEVRGYLRAGVLPSTVLRKLKSDLKSAEYLPPPGCSLAFGGESSKRGEAVEQLMSNVSILATGIGFVLVFSLKSFRAMLIILGIGVLSFGMAIAALAAAHYPFGFTAIVGSMGMVGIAINDSIVVLAELRSDPQCCQGNVHSIINMVMRCTRHVLCTTFTVGCSFIPMFFEGGTFWPPMAMVITAGVFGATGLALYWIPAAHLMMSRKRVREYDPADA